MHPRPVEPAEAGRAGTNAAWPALIEHIGDAHFLPALLGLCAEVAGASDLSLLGCDAGTDASAPVLLAAASRRGDAAQLAGQRYVGEQHYRLDHNLRGLPLLGGQLGVSHLHAAQLPSEAWRAACYDAVGLDERISLLIPAGGSASWIVLNAYRPRRCAISPQSAQQGWRQQAPALAAAVRRHLALAGAAAVVDPAPDPLKGLSERERQVVRAILAGHSAKQAGQQLGLSPTSVATYRQRAFQKLGVRRQVELFRRFGAGSYLLDR